MAGERLRGVAGGLLGGLLFSVAPLELLAVALLVGVLIFWFSGKTLPGFFSASALLTVAVCAAAPLKYRDAARVELMSSCGSVADLARAARWRTQLSQAALRAEVCFVDPRPTVRQVEQALATHGIGVRHHWCGTSMSVLFGPAPISSTLVEAFGS